MLQSEQGKQRLEGVLQSIKNCCEFEVDSGHRLVCSDSHEAPWDVLECSLVDRLREYLRRRLVSGDAERALVRPTQ